MNQKTQALLNSLAKPIALLRSPYLLIAILGVLLIVQVVQNQLVLSNRYFASTAAATEPILIGMRVIMPKLLTPEGVTFSSSEVEGKRHVLIFFSTDCPYCLRDISLWDTMARQGRTRNIGIIAVTRETDREVVARYSRTHNISFPMLIDTEGALFSQLSVRLTPTKILISDDMRVLQILYGLTTRRSGPGDLGTLLAFFDIEPTELPESP